MDRWQWAQWPKRTGIKWVNIEGCHCPIRNLKSSPVLLHQPLGLAAASSTVTPTVHVEVTVQKQRRPQAFGAFGVSFQTPCSSPSSARPQWPQRAFLARPWSASEPEDWDHSQIWMKVQNGWLKKAQTRGPGYGRCPWFINNMDRERRRGSK